MQELPIKLKAGAMPASLLLDRNLPESTKLLWLILSAGHGPARLSWPADLGPALSVLHPTTVARSVELLQSAGWLPACPANCWEARRRSVLMPWDLVMDGRVNARAKMLYGALQLLPGYADHTCQSTFVTLGHLVGAASNTVRLSVFALADYGWLSIAQKHKHNLPIFTLLNPFAVKREAEMHRVQQCVERAQFRGETILGEILSLAVDCDEYDNNARPGWLVYPPTGERLELDRHYYTHKVAVEFQGSQHFGTTERFPDEDEFRQQRARDLVKVALCSERPDEVRLVVITGADLSVEGIRRRVDGLLPLRDLTGHELAISYLDIVGRGYRTRMEKAQRSADPAAYLEWWYQFGEEPR